METNTGFSRIWMHVYMYVCVAYSHVLKLTEIKYRRFRLIREIEKQHIRATMDNLLRQLRLSTYKLLVLISELTGLTVLYIITLILNIIIIH